MAIVRAVVLKRKNRDFIVRPSAVFLEAGDVFRLLNESGYDISVEPPPGAQPKRKKLAALLQLGSGRNPSLKVKKRSLHEVATPLAAPSKRQAQNTLHRYRVTVHAPGGPFAAAGDSDPVIIIDNP